MQTKAVNPPTSAGEFVLIGSCYIGVAWFVAMFSVATIPALLAFAALSCVLLLRRSRATRVIALLVLMSALVGIALARLAE